MPSFLAELPRVALLCTGLLLPGAAWTGVLRVPRSFGLCFAGSVLALYLSLVALQLLSIPIGLASLAGALLMLSAAGFLIASRRQAQGPRDPALVESGWFAVWRGLGPWSAVYGAFWAIALWRAFHEPLSGPDVEFRWGYLAEQLLRHGDLSFYPPRSGADFTAYFWAESIPPGVTALHGWAFACAGRFAPAWTAPASILQLWAVHEFVWHATHALGGRTAARSACLALAATPLLTWATLMGQETGLLAVGTAGVAYASIGWVRERRARWAALAGAFVVIAAGSREYGCVWLVLGAAGLLAAQATPRAWLAYGAVATGGLVWPVRTWLLTGNPFFSLPFGGFPTNPRFLQWIELGAASRASVLHGPDGWLAVARYLTSYAPLALLGWLALAGAVATVRRRKAAALGLGTTLVLVALWMASVPYTDGGLFYSMRAASAALVIGALAAGLALATLRFRPWVAPAIASALVLVTVPATLALPANPWITPAHAWPAFAAPVALRQGPADDAVALALRIAHPQVIVTDGAGFQRRFAPTGVKAIPIWSPEADWLFASALTPAAARQRQRETGISHLLIRKAELNVRYLNACLRATGPSPAFRLRAVGETPLFALFAVEPVDSR